MRQAPHARKPLRNGTRYLWRRHHLGALFIANQREHGRLRSLGLTKAASFGCVHALSVPGTKNAHGTPAAANSAATFLCGIRSGGAIREATWPRHEASDHQCACPTRGDQPTRSWLHCRHTKMDWLGMTYGGKYRATSGRPHSSNAALRLVSNDAPSAEELVGCDTTAAYYTCDRCFWWIVGVAQEPATTELSTCRPTRHTSHDFVLQRCKCCILELTRKSTFRV